MPRGTVLVVPAYNEAARLDRGAFLAWAAAAPDGDSLLFVDDGSTDGTAEALAALAAAAPTRCRVMRLPRNCGKAEAVRRGLLAAAASVGAGGAVGYWDADLATPLEALAEFQAVLYAPGSAVEMVFGARVALLGRSIRRRLARHYLGRGAHAAAARQQCCATRPHSRGGSGGVVRGSCCALPRTRGSALTPRAAAVFATLAANVLGIPIYDTQCGAKLFLVTGAHALATNAPHCSWLSLAKHRTAQRTCCWPSASRSAAAGRSTWS